MSWKFLISFLLKIIFIFILDTKTVKIVYFNPLTFIKFTFGSYSKIKNDTKHYT